MQIVPCSENEFFDLRCARKCVTGRGELIARITPCSELSPVCGYLHENSGFLLECTKIDLAARNVGLL